MKKADAHESSTRRRSRKDIRRRVRTYRIIGILAGLMTTATIAAAGYLAINYWETTQMAGEPTLPQQLASVELPQPSSQVNASVPAVQPTSTAPSVTEDATDEVQTSATEATTETPETTTAKETEKQTEETLSEEEQADLALRMKALEKFENLGVVVDVNNYLNMRTKPTTEADICGKIFYACGVNILEDAGNGWYKIESGGATGYVAKQYISTGERAVDLALKHCRYQADVLRDINVLSKPKEDSSVITAIKAGERYDILSFKGDWAEIEAVEDLSGYVHVEDISAGYYLEEGIVFGYDDSISQTRVDIINKAFEYYGKPYVFGGRDLNNGIDCSAYTYQIYKMFGIDLTESYSITQSTLGKAVSEKDIRPGDLLFYVGRFPGQIGHVAIYIGNGKIIHAASESKGVCVSSWKYVPIVKIRDVIGDR